MANRIVLAGAVGAGLIVGITLFTVTRSGDEPTEAPPAATEPARGAGRAAPLPGPAAGEAAAPPPARAPRRAPAAPLPSEPARAPVEKAPEFGTLRIETDVAGAQVFIDRRFIGTSPVTAENLAPGTYRINVSAPGFDGIAQTIDVEPGPRELTIRLREVRLDAKVAVVHKHRFGSCTGQLVATPEGIRYETSNKEDGFSAPLADVQAFQVDYLDANLRISLRGGGNYNFTDPDGNADRLFVFHRDVERAREQLANAN